MGKDKTSSYRQIITYIHAPKINDKGAVIENESLRSQTNQL